MLATNDSIRSSCKQRRMPVNPVHTLRFASEKMERCVPFWTTSLIIFDILIGDAWTWKSL